MSRRIAASFFKNIYVFLILVGCDPFDVLERYFGVSYNPPTWLRVVLLTIAIGLASWRTIADTKKGIRNDEKLECIKNTLITIDKYQKEAATKQSGIVPSASVKACITRDLITLYPTSRLESVIQEASERNNAEPLFDFYNKFGNILDANGYGLKLQLQSIPQYNDAQADLTSKSVTLCFGRKKRELVQSNIDRVLKGEYGLNSGIVLRDMLKTSQPRNKNEADVIHSAVLGLEDLENIGRAFLTYGLDHLDTKWKPKFSSGQLRSPQVQVMLGGVSKLNKKRFGVLHAFKDMINRQGQSKQR